MTAWWQLDRKVKRAEGPYNKVKGDRQRIRTCEGCPWNCPFCYEPTELKWFDVPEIKCNVVEIMDMNLLCQPNALERIEHLGKQKVNGKVVHYDLTSGIDYRFLTQEIADALKAARFKNMRFAWDWYMRDQYKIKKALRMLTKAGYKPKEIMAFMVCNWKIPYQECCRKLDLLKVWNVQVHDAYYDNQTWKRGSPVKPVHWTAEQLDDFRHVRARKHNQLIRHGVDPEVRM